MQPSQLPKPLRRWAPLIAEVSDERGTDEGYWVYLNPGIWSPDDETHCIHEDTIRECANKLRLVQRCSCCPGDWNEYWKKRIKVLGAAATCREKSSVGKLTKGVRKYLIWVPFNQKLNYLVHGLDEVAAIKG